MNNGSSSSRIELLFEFHTAREFTSLTLHTARRAKEDRLTGVVVNFALESGNYLGKSIRVAPPAEQNPSSLGPYNVTVDLKKRVGRFLQLRLDFTGQWLLLSEVTFQSGKDQRELPAFDLSLLGIPPSPFRMPLRFRPDINKSFALLNNRILGRERDGGLHHFRRAGR